MAEEKKGVKIEEEEEDDDDNNEQVGMKHKGSRCKSEAPEKKFKGAHGYIHLQ